VGQVGLYSYFALGGDFEISATFQVVSLPPPKSGYGASFGIEVEREGADEPRAVSIARLVQPSGAGGFVVKLGVPQERGPLHRRTMNNNEPFPSKAKKGMLVLRRKGAEVTCLASESYEDAPSELCKVPFTAKMVNKVRLFADPGDAPNLVDGKLADVAIKADEITGTPRPDRGVGGLWLTVAALAVLALLGWWYYRRRRSR